MSANLTLKTTSGGSITLAPTDTAGNYIITLPAASGALGGVSNVAVATANGFSGTSSGGSVPSLTLATTITGLLKGDGTAISLATAGVDYIASGGALGTPSSGVATNLTGTAAGLTAGSVTSIPNLTGPVTSVGNATTIVGPIPAVSLSGTISGAGNQINNVIIGTTTPLAGAFTSLSASTTLGVTGVSSLLGGAVVNAATTSFTQKFQSISSTGQSNAMFFKTVANATGPDITIAKSRNGLSDPTAFTAVVNGDTLGALNFGGTDGSALIANGAFGGYVDGVVSAGVVPTALTFATGPTNAAVTRMNISSAGIVSMFAYGAGTATFSAAGNISSVSDETYKVKDGVIADPMPMLMALEPGYYFGKPEANMGPDRQLGFYAQNVRAAIGPEAAPDPEPSKPWGYFDRSVLAVAIEAIKVQKAQIDALTARIVALEAK
jgi:hypothetical protein